MVDFCKVLVDYYSVPYGIIIFELKPKYFQNKKISHSLLFLLWLMCLVNQKQNQKFRWQVEGTNQGIIFY